MTAANEIKNSIKDFRSATVVDDFKDLDFTQVDDGILIVFASWSSPARQNYSATLDFLKRVGYDKKIIVVDTDCFSADQYIATFGKVLGGAGEIFVIKNGVISEKYFGYSSFKDFSQNYQKK